VLSSLFSYVSARRPHKTTETFAESIARNCDLAMDVYIIHRIVICRAMNWTTKLYFTRKNLPPGMVGGPSIAATSHRPARPQIMIIYFDKCPSPLTERSSPQFCVNHLFGPGFLRKIMYGQSHKYSIFSYLPVKEISKYVYRNMQVAEEIPFHYVSFKVPGLNACCQ
jgi:hypothetical protein